MKPHPPAALPPDEIPQDSQAYKGRRLRERTLKFGRMVKVWLLAAAVGALAAGSTILFRWATQQVEYAATGQSGSLVQAARSIAPFHRLVVGTIGGLLAGAALTLGVLWMKRSGTQGDELDYIEAARQGRVDLNNRMTIARTLSALFSVGTGASIGREGPMVQLSAWLATLLARAFVLTPDEKKALLVSGIAAGIAAAYHAPVAGVVFVLELALGFFAATSIGPVLIAVAVASGIVYWMVEPRPIYHLTLLTMTAESLGAALIGGVCFGVLGWALLLLLATSRKAFKRLDSLPLRLGIGGLFVGLVSAAVPEVWGNGYSIVQSVLEGATVIKSPDLIDHPLQTMGASMTVILAAKVLATAISSGSGVVGGVFTPSLFVGAVGGNLLATSAAILLPSGAVGDPRVWSVLGMAAVLTAVTQAPLMAIVMVLEMTGQFQLTVPTMLACGVAYAVGTQLGGQPIYGNPIEARR